MARRGTRGRVIDFKAWTGLPGASQSFATDGTRLAGGSIAFTAPATILRIRVPSVLCFFDNTKQAGDSIDLAFGIGIVSTDAFTLGATAMPDPGGEPEYPWMWWTQLSLFSDAAVSFEGTGISVVRFSVDSKAMRRVAPGQSLVPIVQASGATGAPTTFVRWGNGRVLIGT